MKKNNLHNIKDSGFKVPDNYFDQVESEIYNQIRLREKVATSGFKTPEGYFENFEDDLLSQLAKDETIKMFSYTKVISAIAIAACLVLMFNVFFNTSEELSFDSLETASIENYLEDEDFSTYELASFLNVAELQKSDFINTSIPEEQLKNYLLEHSDIEDLMLN